MTKVNVDTLKPWIAQRITDLLGLEDDVVVEFVYNQLEERVGGCLQLSPFFFKVDAIYYHVSHSKNSSVY